MDRLNSLFSGLSYHYHNFSQYIPDQMTLFFRNRVFNGSRCSSCRNFIVSHTPGILINAFTVSYTGLSILIDVSISIARSFTKPKENIDFGEVDEDSDIDDDEPVSEGGRSSVSNPDPSNENPVSSKDDLFIEAQDLLKGTNGQTVNIEAAGQLFKLLVENSRTPLLFSL